MAPATVFSIAIRIIALGFAASAIMSLSFLGLMISQYLRPDIASTPFSVIAMSLTIILSLIAAVVLYRTADRIALSAYGDASSSSVSSPMNPREWLLLTVRVLGIVCIVFSLPQLLGQGIFHKAVMMNPIQGVLTHTLPGIIQVAIGLIFIRKTEGVAGLVLGENRTPQD